MVKFRMKTKIMAVVTFLVMSVVVIFGGYDMQNAEATGGTDYVKYTFATGQIQTYNLPEIPTRSFNLPRVVITLDDDPRENADATSSVVNIIGTKSNRKKCSTGFIIGEHEIMTAAHCVYDTSTGTPLDSLQIKINNSNPSYLNGENVITLNAVTAHFPKNLKDSVDANPTTTFTNNQVAMDYAIITVQENLSNYGKFYLGSVTNGVNNTPLHALGYYYYGANGTTASLKISNGTIEDLKDNMYYTSCEIYGGSSGGPIYVESNFGVPGTSDEEYQIKTYKTVVGINSVGNSANHAGSQRIDSEVLQFAYDNDYL